jgi:hypothetical protein
MSPTMPISVRSQNKLRPAWYALACLALFGCGSAWVPLAQRAAGQRAAVRAIEDLGGDITYDFELLGNAEPPGPRWLRAWIGDDYFRRVTSVAFWDPHTTDEHLRILTTLNRVRRVYLDGTQVTDAGLVHLEHLTDLELLSLRSTHVTVETRERLQKRLPSCGIR